MKQEYANTEAAKVDGAHHFAAAFDARLCSLAFPMTLTRSLLALLTGLAFAAPLHAQTATSIAAGLQPFVDRHELAGAVALVVDREKVLAVESVGFADITGGQALKTDALFWIASQSKPMTAAALESLGK